MVQVGVFWCKIVNMTTTKKTRRLVRRSVSLSAELDNKVQKIARHQNWSANRVLETLIQAGIEAKEAEKTRFFLLAERLRATSNDQEAKQIKEELARITFGL